MNYTIKNEQISLTVSSTGAEMQSIIKDGVEYLWQGDPTYWKGRAYNLFPFCGRLYDGKYTYDNKEYQMLIHGLARYNEFNMVLSTSDSLCFTFKYNEDTLKQYPFKFLFTVLYRIDNNKINITYKVDNLDDKVIYFGLGGHPGFNVPLNKDLAFEDYYLEFSNSSKPKKVRFSDTCFALEGLDGYELIDDKKISLRHDLFDNDIVCLKDTSGAVTIKSDKDDKSITVNYPNMTYVGFWHTCKTDAPFICIEPWMSLPSKDGVIEDFSKKEDLIALNPANNYLNTWNIELK